MSATILQRKKWGRNEERGIISSQKTTILFPSSSKKHRKDCSDRSEEAKEVLWYALSDYKDKEIKFLVIKTRRNY